MKILFLNGSPKHSGSASERLIAALSLRFENDATTLRAMGADGKDFIEKIAGVDALVIVFPIYVDGLPSHLLHLLYEAKDKIKSINPNVKVYGVANCGFYEGRQNALALEMLQHFCTAAGIQWGQGLGVGAGGMTGAVSVSVGAGPLKSFGLALDKLAASIQNGASGEDFFVEPNFPKFLYKLGGHSGWKRQGKDNGLKPRALYRRW